MSGGIVFSRRILKNDQQTYVPDPEVASRLLEWYGREGRDLPWRRTRDPYRIWISEVILQQTRVAQGMSYYHRFLELFLDVAALASAPEDLVLKCWQGLGYYSRARNLLAAARRIVETHGGVFPTDYAARTVDVRPVKQGRTAVEPRYFNYLHVECGDELVLRRRGAGDIWQGLYEFPLIETPEPVEYTVLAAMPEFCALFKDAGAVCLAGTVTMPVHQLSHRAIHAVFYRIVVERWTPSLREMLVIPREILGDYAVSRLTERYLSR